jgi:competence protein ComEA
MLEAKMKQVGDGIGGLGARVKAGVAGSRWAGLVGKTAGYLVAFTMLTLVGSGRLSGWLAPPARLSLAIPTAAAAAPPPSPSAPPLSPTAAPPAPPAPSDAGAADAASAESAAEDAGAATPGVAADGKVILNLATEDDLRRLPGIGPTRARAILALRARLKRFARVEDLLKVKGLGRRSMARLRPLVRVD